MADTQIFPDRDWAPPRIGRRAPRPARAQPPALTSAGAWRVALLRDWDAIAGQWQAARGDGAAATPFQTAEWLESFYAAIKADPATQPLIAWIEDAESGAFAMALPLVCRRDGALTRISFADLGMSDFNAPLLGPAAPRNGGEARAAWAALRRALPRADIVQFEKMPPQVEGRVNPFAVLGGARVSAVNGNLIAMGEDFEAWQSSLSRTVRKELRRTWRVFNRRENVSFECIEDPREALNVLEAMEAQQQTRLDELGLAYKLGDPVTASLYRNLLARNIASGFAVLGILKSGSECVAGLLGIRQGNRVVFIRLTNAGGEWTNCSPGRLVISRLLPELHARGLRKFDFSVGNFTYKRHFGAVRQPMVDFSAPRSLRGGLVHARLMMGAVLRRYPGLRRAVRRILGKPDLREEA
jgi:CelD/BcsL family acetyltransferase involved in cellulose biosynthesis